MRVCGYAYLWNGTYNINWGISMNYFSLNYNIIRDNNNTLLLIILLIILLILLLL